jgi:NADH-ubiquinone oxidoreductase chain 4L
MVYRGLYIFIFGLLSLVYRRKHFLSLLLSLEFIIIGNLLLVLIFIMLRQCELLVFYLVVVVCEARLGLGILVLRVFSFGNGYIQGYSVLEC